MSVPGDTEMWEYKVEQREQCWPNEHMTHLREMGEEGWELCGVPTQHWLTTAGMWAACCLTWKRRRRAEVGSEQRAKELKAELRRVAVVRCDDGNPERPDLKGGDSWYCRCCGCRSPVSQGELHETGCDAAP